MKEIAVTDGEEFRKKGKKKKRKREFIPNSPQEFLFFLWSPNSKLLLVTFHTEGLLFVIDVLGRKWSGCGLQRWREGFE